MPAIELHVPAGHREHLSMAPTPVLVGQCPRWDTQPTKILQVINSPSVKMTPPQSCCSNNQVDTFGRPAIFPWFFHKDLGCSNNWENSHRLKPQERWHPLGYSRYHSGSGCIAPCCSARVGHSKCQLHLEENINFCSCFGYHENPHLRQNLAYIINFPVEGREKLGQRAGREQGSQRITKLLHWILYL